MRLLIIDDEEHVVETIRLLVDWSALGFDNIKECTDSTAALDLVNEFQPDLVLTDMMMPKVHGTQLVERIVSIDTSIKIIVISGHSDFNYIQHTLRYGGIDYITKPIIEEQLQEAAEKAVEKIREEDSAAAAIRKVHQLDLLYWEQIFHDIYECKSLSDRAALQLSDTYGLETGTLIRIAVLELKDYEALLTKSFCNDSKLMDFAFRNICQEVIDASVIKGYVHRKSDMNQRLFILVWGHVKALDMVADCICRTIRQIYDVDCCVSISEAYRFPDSVCNAKSDVISVLENRNLMQPINDIYRLSDVNVSDMNAPVVDPNHILIGMKSKSRKQLEYTVHESLQEIRQMPFIREKDLRIILASLERCISYCCEKLDLRSIEWEMKIPKSVYFSQALPENLEKTFGIYAAHVMSAYMKMGSGERDIIEAVKKYLDKNYRSQLNMIQLSGEFSISKEHLSRQFKKRYRMTVMEYVTKLRINAASNHLKSLNLSIREVSALVGYKDEKYFSKVFKKSTGMSPKDFRKDQQP